MMLITNIYLPGTAQSKREPVGGTAASGAIDLLHLHLGLSSSVLTTALPTLADLYDPLTMPPALLKAQIGRAHV